MSKRTFKGPTAIYQLQQFIAKNNPHYQISAYSGKNHSAEQMIQIVYINRV